MTSLATCIGRAIIASTTMVTIALMCINGIDDWHISSVLGFGLGTFLMIPTYKKEGDDDR